MANSQMFQVPAEAYDRWVGRYSLPLAAALIDFAGVEPGMKALDVGCGPGALSSALVGRLGAMNVYAVDPSEPFLEAFRTRLPGVNALHASAESLPFPDAEFDAVLSQLVVNFMNDPHAGVREMSRVTRAGGIVAACVWDYGGEMRLIRAFWDSAREVAPERGAAADESNMKLRAEGELAELWEQLGLSEVRAGELVVTAGYESFDDLWSPLSSGIGPAGAFWKTLDEPARAALYDDLRARLGVGDAPFELTARAWAAAGTVAAS
jgi:ubiquinone/menaquinone biosynthesis C-methylase UbiE